MTPRMFFPERDELARATRLLTKRLSEAGVDLTHAHVAATFDLLEDSPPGAADAIAHVAGITDEERAKATVEVRKALTYGEGDKVMVIHSWLALVRASEVGGEAYTRGIDRVMAKAPKGEGWGAWTCPVCGREYPDDYEPTHCEDCAAGLIRGRLVTEEDAERLGFENPTRKD